MLDQWLEQCGVSFRKASLIQDKTRREGPRCLPVCSFIKRGLTETSQLGLFFHPTQWRATLFAKVSAPGARLRSQSLWTKPEERRMEGEREGGGGDGGRERWQCAHWTQSRHLILIYNKRFTLAIKKKTKNNNKSASSCNLYLSLCLL